MRIGVTGARGFVGRWLEAELVASGHEVIGVDQPELDVCDPDRVGAWLRETAPDAVAHLAGVAFGPDARADPATAFAVNVGGTTSLMNAAATLTRPPVVLVSGSADVYAPPVAARALTEDDATGPVAPYGVSKLAQEKAAIAAAASRGLAVVVTRSFNHTGPGQRPVFVVPAMAGRVAAVADGTTDVVTVGNLDVRRDFMDVRDVVIAYRLLLEALGDGRLPTGGLIQNVASGRAIAIRDIVTDLCAIAGVDPAIVVDPALVRSGEPGYIVGDRSRLERTTGWQPRIPWHQTLRDVYADVAATRQAG